MLPTPLLRRAALLAALAVAGMPAVAHADSIVFVRDANVWLADGDGTGLHQVTTDGTAQQPYRVPVQADDGTIAASHGEQIVRLRQNGEVLGRIDPAPLVDSAGQPVDGPPVNLAISPDGARIAYSLAGHGCPVGADCMTRAVTAFTDSGALTPAATYGTLHRRNPSFVTNTRVLVFGGYGGQVNVADLGDPAETHWFDDRDVYGQADATDLGDGELNRQGTQLALVRSYGAGTHLIWYAVAPGAQSAKPPAVPAPLCKTGAEEGLHGPTWSPSGDALAFGGNAGIYVTRAGADCAQSAPALLISGASQPDWGPADVAPGPRTPDGGGGPGAGPGAPAEGAATLTVRRARARAMARRGVAVAVACPAACRIRAELVPGRRAARRLGVRAGRKVATATHALAAAGTARFAVKPARKLRGRFARLAGAKLTLRVTVTDAAGAKQVLRRTVRPR